MTTLYYAGTEIGDVDYVTIEDIARAVGKSVDDLVYDYASETHTVKEMCKADMEELKDDLLEDILEGDYDMDGDLTLIEEDDDDDDDDDEEEYFSYSPKITIGYYTDKGTDKLEMDKITKPTYAACGCPICDSKLKVIAKLERMTRMPTLYASICKGCGAHISFGSDETIFFPLKEEGDGKE